MKKVEVLSYDAAWPEAFAQESQQISKALGKNIAAIHHKSHPHRLALLQTARI